MLKEAMSDPFIDGISSAVTGQITQETDQIEPEYYNVEEMGELSSALIAHLHHLKKHKKAQQLQSHISKGKYADSETLMKHFSAKHNVTVMVFEATSGKKANRTKVHSNPRSQERSSQLCLLKCNKECPTLGRRVDSYSIIWPSGDLIKLKQTISSQITQLTKELEGLELEDLKDLYSNVSHKLTTRNGYVADYNILLTALMGCNTNSLFLGSKGNACCGYLNRSRFFF